MKGNTKLTHKQAYDKIIDAYFKDEIQPYDAKFCFCGTLAENSYDWHNRSSNIFEEIKHRDYKYYKGVDYARMEHALLSNINGLPNYHSDYETALFSAMSAALDVLKQIHIERGEVIDEVPVFTKRELVKV